MPSPWRRSPLRGSRSEISKNCCDPFTFLSDFVSVRAECVKNVFLFFNSKPADDQRTSRDDQPAQCLRMALKERSCEVRNDEIRGLQQQPGQIDLADGDRIGAAVCVHIVLRILQRIRVIVDGHHMNRTKSPRRQRENTTACSHVDRPQPIEILLLQELET